VLSLSIMLHWSRYELRVEQKEHQACIWCSVCSSGTALYVPRKQVLHIHISTPSVFCCIENLSAIHNMADLFTYMLLWWLIGHGLSRCIMGCLWLGLLAFNIYSDHTYVTVNLRLQLHTILTVAFGFRLVLSVCFVTKRYILQQHFGQPLDTPTLPFVHNC